MAEQKRKIAADLAWRAAIDAWADWLTAAGRPPDTTVALRRYQLTRYAEEHPGANPFGATPDELAAWMATQTWGPETRRSYRSALVSYHDWLTATGRRPDNPARLLPPVKPGQGRPRPTPEAVLTAALVEADDRERLMLLLAAREGLRRGEIAKVHTRDVIHDRGGASLIVHGKGRKTRVVPLCSEVALLLRELPEGFAFPGQIRGHLSPARVGELVSALMPDGWTAHTLRHRFATAAYAPQRDLLAVQALLGHASPATTQRYVQLPDDALRAAISGAA